MTTDKDQGGRDSYEHSWEPDVAHRISNDISKLNQEERDEPQQKQPYMIALVGIPGGGKSVSALLLANLLEEQCSLSTMIMPHDGYHYPLEQLKLFPNPDDVIYRRGAPDTFDPQSLLRDLKRIRYGAANATRDSDGNVENIIFVPGFDHGIGDPQPEAHCFDRSRHQIVICEGLVSFC